MSAKYGNRELISDELMAEAKRISSECLGDKCNRCVSECVMLTELKTSPMSICLSLTENNYINPLIAYSCTNCGLCGNVCPKGLSINKVLIPARQEIARWNGNKSPFKSHHGVGLHQMFSFLGLFTTKSAGNAVEKGE